MVVVPPNQIPNPALPNPHDPPAPVPTPHILDPLPPPIPPAHVPDPVQLQLPPVHVPNPMLPPAPPIQIPQLNWSYFKPECSEKPEENAEAHLLRRNDWMETHNYPEVAKLQRFCLILTSEARLWYETLRPIAVDWTGLQESFRQQ